MENKRKTVDNNEEMQQPSKEADRILLAREICKAAKSFIGRYDIENINIMAQSVHPTFALMSNGKGFAGTIILCNVTLDNEDYGEDSFDAGDIDDE